MWGPGNVIGWELNNPSTSGSKTVYASATDYAGNIGLATLVFELDLEQPLVNLHAYSVRSETAVVEDGQPDVRDEWVSLLPSSAEPVLLGTPNAQFIVEVSGANIEYQVGFENFNSLYEWLEAGTQSSCILEAPGEALPLQISVLELSEGNGALGLRRPSKFACGALAKNRRRRCPTPILWFWSWKLKAPAVNSTRIPSITDWGALIARALQRPSARTP